MAVDIVMPQMGESIFEGTITRWLKKPGDKVERDEPLFEISTDKVDAEIPSPSAGVLKEIKVAEGQTVPIQTVVGVIDAAGSAAAPAPPPVPAKTQAPAPAKAPTAAPAAPRAVPAPVAAQPVAASARRRRRMEGAFIARRSFAVWPRNMALIFRLCKERGPEGASANKTLKQSLQDREVRPQPCLRSFRFLRRGPFSCPRRPPRPRWLLPGRPACTLRWRSRPRCRARRFTSGITKSSR